MYKNGDSSCGQGAVDKMKRLFIILTLLTLTCVIAHGQTTKKNSPELFINTTPPIEDSTLLFLGTINSKPTVNAIVGEHNLSYNLNPIIDSKNEIEIRFYRDFFGKEQSIVTLIYNKGKWSSSYKLQNMDNTINGKYPEDDSLMKIRYYKNFNRDKFEIINKTYNYDSLFKILAINNIFNQKWDDERSAKTNFLNKTNNKIETHSPPHYLDGESYNIFYKVSYSFGSCYFDNVGDKVKEMPNLTFLKEQKNIIGVFDILSTK